MIATQNQVDPSKTLAIRKKYANQQRRIFAAAVANTQTALANLPENPTQNQMDNYLAALLALLMINITTGNAVYPYVQAAYLRGVTNANLDLRAGGLSVVGAETAVLTQAAHRFSLQARQDSTQAMIRDVYMGTVNNVGDEIGTGGERPLIDRVNGQLRKGMNLAITVGATAIVGIVADAFLNRVADFGISLVSAVAEAQFTTQGDDKVCFRCLELEQRDNGNGSGVYTIQEARGIIPVHHNCLFPDTLITAVDGIASISKRVYEGDLIVIDTASGKQISVTPNHPILTRVGWVAAKHIQTGDKLFSDKLSVSRENNTEYRPSTIKEIFDTSLVSSSFLPVEVPISPKDFHNDMGIRQAEVAVISANRHLFDNHFPLLQQGIINNRLESPSQFSYPFSGQGSLYPFIDRPFPTSGSVMGGSSLVPSLCRRHSRPFDSLGHRLIASHDTVINQPFSYDTTRDTVDFRERILGDSRPVFLDDFVNWQVDTVKSTRCVSYSGHVYNLHTKKGYYSANNIITHNCRCTWTAIILGHNIPFLRF